jgi:cytoskeleton protein RodZ
MPKDSGSVAPDMFSTNGVQDTVTAMTPSLESLALVDGAHLGEGLKAAREALGLSLQDVADATRIRRLYLTALETMDVAQMPSRPFAIGYVRAYAKVLGIDEERAVERFKHDAPAETEVLQAPVGVQTERDPRLILIAVGVVLVLGAIVVWNVAQRSMADRAPPPPPPMAVVPPAALPQGPVALGAALPAPFESTIPTPYVTPGLEADRVEGTPAPVKSAAPLPEAPLTNPNAAVFGAPAEESVISIRARKAVTLVVNGVGGQPIFVRVLSAGETYRVPSTGAASLDVSDPSAVDVYNQGQFIGQLPLPITPVSRLGG